LGVEPEHLFRWDLDKTYLMTRFESLSGLWQAATEKPQDKRAYPGATPLLAALSNDARYRLGIVSGSPVSMGDTLRAKLELDGVRVHRMTLKPQGKNLLRLRFKALRDQLGYKLPALLEWRVQGSGAPETLVGDDVEMDAFIYALYGAILRGEVAPQELQQVLEEGQVVRPVRTRTLALSQAALSAGPRDVVRRILVHLDKRTAPSALARLDPRIVPFHNYLQAAAVLFADGRVHADVVVDVARDILERTELGPRALASSVEDLTRRGALSAPSHRELGQTLHQAMDLPLSASPAARAPEVHESLGWLELFRRETVRAQVAREL